MQSTYSATLLLLVLCGAIITFFFLLTYQSILSVLGAEGKVFKEAVKYSRIIILGSILQTTGAGILPVLRNKNRAVGAMLSMTAGLLVNIGCNYYLMFVCGMGIKGAAFGTVAAQGVVILIGGTLLIREREDSFVWCLKSKICRNIFKVGFTAFGVSLAPSITLVFTNWQCLAYGGDAAVACYAVISYIVFPVQSMLAGIGDGVQPLMSCMSGAGKTEEVEKIKGAACLFALILGGIAFVLCVALSGKISGWFGLSREGASYFKVGIVVSACAFWISGIVRLNITRLNATLQAKRAMALIYTESLIVAPTLLFALPLAAGLKGVWLSLPVTGICMLLIYCLMEEKRNENVLET